MVESKPLPVGKGRIGDIASSSLISLCCFLTRFLCTVSIPFSFLSSFVICNSLSWERKISE